MENIEELSEVETRFYLHFWARKLCWRIEQEIQDKGELTDIVSKINELSLHLREFID